MSGQRQPIELVIAKGAKHLTKNEIQERRAREIQPVTDDITAPPYLTKKQRKEFDKIASQLTKLKIMGETDVDALARYIIANDLYLNAVKQLRKSEVKDDFFMFDSWSKVQERYYKQCRTAASDLGLTISSRCKLVVPATNPTKPKENKFAKFQKGAAVSE